MLEPGARAPQFTATDHRGRRVSLADLAGSTVVLWFYPKADTPGCTKEGCAFRDLAAEFEAKGARVFGVSFDDAAENAAFAEKFHFPFPLLCDTGRAIGLAYGACDSPKDEHARRISYVIGPDGTIRRAFAKVDPRTHADEVLALL